MTRIYQTSNLWECFLKECPWMARIPVFRMWAFGVFVRSYYKYKLPM